MKGVFILFLLAFGFFLFLNPALAQEVPPPEEEEEGPWGWTRAEYYNAKFGEEG